MVITELSVNTVLMLCEKFGMKYCLSNYAIMTKVREKEHILCYTGSDIVDAHNMCEELGRAYSAQTFYISPEIVEIS